MKLQDQREQYRQAASAVGADARFHPRSAGQIFDAMLTKGEGVFSSLAKFAEGVFQTVLRNVFQNAVQGLFTTGAGILSRVGGGAAGGARLQEQIGGGATSVGARDCNQGWILRRSSAGCFGDRRRWRMHGAGCGQR